MPEHRLQLKLVKVVRVEPRGDYRLALRFSDGNEGERDFANMIAEGGVMVEPLRDPTFFARAFIDDGILTWPNGFDLDSIALHEARGSAATNCGVTPPPDDDRMYLREKCGVECG